MSSNSTDELFFFKDSSGNKISAILSSPEKPNKKAVILLHCFTCTKYHRVIRNVSESLVEKGFTTLRFDFSGNGESEGKIEDSFYTKMIDEVKKAVDFFQKKGFKKISVGGHSLGAMVSLLAASEDSRISSVIFIAGSSEAARVRQVFSDDVLEKVEKEGIATGHAYGRDIPIKREFLRDIEKYNVGYAAATLNRPILIIHPIQDEIINFYHARQLFEWVKSKKTLVALENCDHLFKKPLAIEKLREEVSKWALKNI